MNLATASPAPQAYLTTRSVGRVPPSDRRSWQARFCKRHRAALVEHLGSKATVTQSCLIDAATDIALELEVMRRRRDERGALSLHDARCFLSFQNTYRRHLLALGIKGAPVATPSLAERVAAHAAQRGEAP